MNMKTLFILLICYCSFSAQAQNYQCLQSGLKHYFINSTGYVRGIRIDSVRTMGDSTIYYPYHTPRGYYSRSGSGTFLDSMGGSWLGKHVVQRNGTFLFDNLWHDTVVIKTQAHAGDAWTFYRDTTTLYYEASVIAEDTMTVLGSVDSIKRILITAHNSTGIVTTDPVDSFQIILSKNNGFVQVFDLYTFPYHAPDSAYTQGLDYYLDHLIPSTGPFIPAQTNAVFSLINFIDPTFVQLYQWNVGDVYEYSVCNSSFDHYNAGCDPVEYYFIDSINATSISTGSTSYYFNGSVSGYAGPLPTYYYPSGFPIYSTTANDGELTYDSALLYDTTFMPEEFGQAAFWGYHQNDSSYCINNTLYSIQNNIEIQGAEYFPPFEAYSGPSLYKSPLGLLSNIKESPGVIGLDDVYSQQLIYYERGGSPCGRIFIAPTSVINIKTTGNVITLFPNPAITDLTITDTNRITTIVISNLVGQTVYSHDYNEDNVKVDVANMPAGVYFVKINDIEVRKFVKE